MTAPEGTTPERLAEIVDGAPAGTDDERALLALMEETRDLEPGASEELRRRVLDGPPPAPVPARLDPRRWFGGADGRRRMLVAGPVVAGLIAVAIAVPALNDSGPSAASRDRDAAAVATADGAAGAPEAERLRSADAAATPAPEALSAADSAVAPPAAAAVGGGPIVKAQAPSAEPGRAQQVTATTRVQVKDVAALSRASASAMRTVRGLGGFTASSDYSVPNGAEGTNVLVMRVPVARADEALAAFGRLGTVTGQSATIVDLTGRLVAVGDRIGVLTDRVATLRAQLAASPGDPAIAADLARAEAALRRATATRAATLAATRLATLRLTLTTEAPPAPVTGDSRFGGPISRAGERLADAAAWLLGALVLTGPLLLMLGLAGWAVARRRGRATRRLMGAR